MRVGADWWIEMRVEGEWWSNELACLNQCVKERVRTLRIAGL